VFLFLHAQTTDRTSDPKIKRLPTFFSGGHLVSFGSAKVIASQIVN
jgi:hypothetical protein